MKITTYPFTASADHENIEYFDSVMMENVSDIFFKFSDGYQWFPEWPKDQNTSRVMPQLIEIKLLLDDQEIEWLISPRINHVYEY